MARTIWTELPDSHNVLFPLAGISPIASISRNSTGRIGGFVCCGAAYRRYHSHYSNTLGDGIHGAFIVHSPEDPLKRGVNFDEEMAVLVGDW